MYCATADLEKLMSAESLRQLADDGPDGPAYEAVLAEAIEQADREIDAYIGVVQEVPLDPVPPLVANLSAKIAVYNLYRRRDHLDGGAWADEYKRAMALLSKIASGGLSLGKSGEAGSGPAEPLEPNTMIVNTPPPYFDDLEKF